MKVLLWGIDSPWTLNFIENFLLKSNDEIWIFQRESKKNSDFYEKYGIHFIKLPSIVTEEYDKEEKNVIQLLYFHFLMLKSIIKVGPFDLINMQYVEYSELIDVIILKFVFKAKIILSFWGSDLFRVDSSKLNFIGKMSEFADFITFDNIDLKLKFKKIVKQPNLIPKKIVMLGLPVLDIIKKKFDCNEKEIIRKKWGIDDKKIVIAIGYNGIPAQQHKRVLKVLEELDDINKEKIIVVLQMSYGGTRTYRNSVISAAKRAGLQYIDIQNYLTESEVAEIRILTDIFINAQATDAFSGSVGEYLFAETILINAKWLRYKELERYNFDYLEFEDFDEIPQIIKRALEIKINFEKNKKLVWKLRSWKYCAPKWKNVYRRVCTCAEDSSNFGRRKRNKALSIYHSNAKTFGSDS